MTAIQSIIINELVHRKKLQKNNNYPQETILKNCEKNGGAQTISSAFNEYLIKTQDHKE